MKMKKLIPALAILGSAVAFVAYKMKKDEQRKIMELDQDLLCDHEECGCGDSCSCEEEEEEEHRREPNPTFDQQEDTSTHSDYPNLTNSMIEDIHDMNVEAIDSLKLDGDVSENERPIQHQVMFKTSEDLENFRNKVVNKGFVVTKGDGEYDLNILHITDINQVKLMSHVLYIADQAYANHGSYKGWVSKVTY